MNGLEVASAVPLRPGERAITSEMQRVIDERRSSTYSTNQFAANRDELRCLAIAADARNAVASPLTELWSDLVSRKRTALYGFCSDERSFLILNPSFPAGPPMPVCEQVLLERYLLGESEKVLAWDHGVANSTVASRLSRSLASFGLGGAARAAPLLVTVAAHASRSLTNLQGRASLVRWRGAPFLAISAPRPDGERVPELSVAEFDVARLIVEGLSSSDIAIRRGVSVRTVANQIGSAFRKLRISGRRHLVAQLIRRAASPDSVELSVQPVSHAGLGWSSRIGSAFEGGLA